MEEKSIGDALTMRGGVRDILGRIDQYELVRELGGGGFGTVYLANDTVAGIDVAVKGLPPLVRHNKEELENIRRNFALVSRLHHPNIAAALTLHPVAKAVYNDRSDAEKLRVFEGDTLVVMQYAPGVTLSQWRRQFPDGKLPLDTALEITRQVADALDYAHREKILHRDIKPANVMIETDAAGKVAARVLDFGLAAEIRSSMGRVSQQVNDTSGTRPYMAPEQWLGKVQGRGTDQYALAVLFFELVTGDVPFASVFETGDPIVMMNVVGREAPEISSTLPKPVRAALAKALSKAQDERFVTCADFVRALEGKVKVKSSSGGKSSLPKIAGVFLAVLCFSGGVLFWRSEQEKARVAAEARAAAEREAAEQAAQAERLAAEKKMAEAERARQAEAVRLKAEKEAAEERARKEEAERKAEALRREEARLVEERKSKEESEQKALEAKRQKEVVKSQHERSRRELYIALAKVETALEKFRAFEHLDAIRPQYEDVVAKYKASKAALDADDLEVAVEMSRELSAPQAQMENAIPTIRRFHTLKPEVEMARRNAIAAEASVYAEKEFDFAEVHWRKASELYDAKEFARAVGELSDLESLYATAKKVAQENPKALYGKGCVLQKAGKYTEAFDCFRRAADKNYPDGLANLGLCHLKGTGVDKDENKAFALFRDAAVRGCVRAQYFLGGCYAKAIGTKYDKDSAKVWMAIASMNGSKAAADFLIEAGWTLSGDEKRGIDEMLKYGRTSVELSGSLKAVLELLDEKNEKVRK